MQLATLDDVAALVGSAVPAEAEPTVTRLIELASARVAEYCRQTFEAKADETIEMLAAWERSIELPERPVVDIHSITAVGINGVPYGFDVPVLIDPLFYRWRSNGEVEHAAHSWSGYDLEIVYSHGYVLPGGSAPEHDPPLTFPNLPMEIEAVCAEVVASVFLRQQQTSQGGVRSEMLGSYQVSYADVGTDQLTFTERHLNTLTRYRRRFASLKTPTR